MGRVGKWVIGNGEGEMKRAKGRERQRGCFRKVVNSLFSVILGLDPGIHLLLIVTMDAASSAT